MNQTKNTIRWGIIGLGRIAREFAKDLELVKDATLVAVASGSPDRAKDFAGEFDVKYAFGSYRELFECAEVDAVYIATYHHRHADNSIMAMEHGKHVLCEKPVAMNAADTERMIAASRINSTFFMEALWSRFNPAIRKVKQLVDSGEIGKVRNIHADFSFYALDEDERGRLLNVELGGGSLMDIGVYPLFLSYLLLGLPDEVMATSKFFHTGAEIQTSMLLDYPGAHALLSSSLANNSDMKARIGGEEGEIIIEADWHEAQGFTLIKEGWEKRFNLPTKGKGYAHEIEEVHHCLRRGVVESELWSHRDSLELINLVDQVRHKAGITYPFDK